MYRMPYSLHEKTGLVSQPFNINHILKFEKEEASPNTVKRHKFLDREEAKAGEASELFQKAFDFTGQRDVKKNYVEQKDRKKYVESRLRKCTSNP